MKIINTLSGNKELFKPLIAPTVHMYVCGITPYDFAHLGHGRSAVVFDLLCRLLNFFDYKVIYCRNFTDVDDKLIARAKTELGDETRYHEIAQRFMHSYKQNMSALNCLTPTHEPLVTKHIPDIIDFVQNLIEAGKAYVVEGDVYYSIPTFPDYGKLSKQKLDELCAGARVDISEKKRNPLDFALWKREGEGNFWKSPWGYGRPGWHIECSVLAFLYLGRQLDIHGGGMDLIFPHHENEIAQSEGLFGVQFVHYWVHNAFVCINKEKMSKSLGNFFTLHEIFNKVPPILLRFYFLNHYYRAPLDFALEDVKTLRKSYQRLCRALAHSNVQPQFTHHEIRQSSLVQKMLTFLEDDLNVAGMWGALFENLENIAHDDHEKARVKQFITQVMGLPLELLHEEEFLMTPEIEQLLHEREQARAAKEWQRADIIRDKLTALGYQVKDKKS